MKNNSLTILYSALLPLLGTLLISCSKPNSTNPTAPEGTGQSPIVSPAVPVGPRPQGTDFGSGGDAYAAEFKDIGRMVVRRLKSREVREVEGISVTSFEEVSEKLVVTTTEAALKKGDIPVDALNYADQMKVELSLVHWASSMDFSRKRRLVIHEILGLMRKDDSDYRLTSQFLKDMGFLHDVRFDEFNLTGPVAKTIIEKMPWRASEMSEEAHSRYVRETNYSAKREGGRNYISCKKMVYQNLSELGEPDAPPHYICWFGCQTTISDNGTILIALGPAWSEDNRHPLWRLFDEKESFDYGVIKGDKGNFIQTGITGNFYELEIFP